MKQSNSMIFRNLPRNIGYFVLLAILIVAVIGISSGVRAQQYGQKNGINNVPETKSAYKHTFETRLTGQEEVPAVKTNTTGMFTLWVPQDENRLLHKLEISNGDNVTAAHLHCGKKGSNGPAIVTLYSTNNPRDISGTLAEGNIVENDIMDAASNCEPRIETMAHLVQAIREGKIYVNVHDQQHPNGVVRGQLAYGGKMTEKKFGLEGVKIQELADSPTGTKSFLVTIDTDVLRKISNELDRWVNELKRITR